MKRLIIFITIIFSSFSVFAQSDIVTDSFKVDGNCSMCKKRIEDAAYIKGVKRADWDEHSHILTLVYRSSKTTRIKVEESIAKSGHNTADIKAVREGYNSLPECCQYETNTCNH